MIKNAYMKELRGKRSMLEVCTKIGIPKSTYACIENGLRQGKPETVLKIARFYGVSIEDLYFPKSIEKES